MAVQLDARIRRSGTGAAIYLPAATMREKKLKVGEKVSVVVLKKADFSSIFGIARERILSGEAQRMKGRTRAEEADR